jgi:hypothetical protein
MLNIALSAINTQQPYQRGLDFVIGKGRQRELARHLYGGHEWGEWVGGKKGGGGVSLMFSTSLWSTRCSLGPLMHAVQEMWDLSKHPSLIGMVVTNTADNNW